MSYPLVCLGDGHDGIWNLFEQIATPFRSAKKSLIGITSRKIYSRSAVPKERLHQAEALLWHGDVEAVQALFADCRRKRLRNECAYLDHHRSRIVNYAYCQTMLLKPIPIGEECS